MTTPSRRDLFRKGATAAAALAASQALPASIAHALSIPARVRTGTIKDVKHVVILTQENRAFDHYFGTLKGVRGFGDRHVIPAPPLAGAEHRTAFVQPNEKDEAPALIAPYRFNTKQDFQTLRPPSTPHSFPDAQAAWDEGRLSQWPKAKHNHAMGYFTREDIPFQFALAEAFTLCDAYHCGIHAGTNPNRLFIWSGTVNADGQHNGPALDNGYDEISHDPRGHGGYDWTTYPERLQAAGVTWQVYQDMKDNFTDNPLVGFKLYRGAAKAEKGLASQIADRAVRTRALDKLAEDVKSGKLPQVSWIIGTARGSEHPDTSSPAEGAEYTAKVLEILTSNPALWSQTVFLVNFDENDGFFDHAPPPAPPSLDPASHEPLGHSDIDTIDERHVVAQGREALLGRPYGLGPRVPLYAISPWSRGGYVSSEVFDHTSILRFLEARFGVAEKNISPWRRAVCGDLTSLFNFKTPNHEPFFNTLPVTGPLAEQSRTILKKVAPKPPLDLAAPPQEAGVRPRRAGPYSLAASARPVAEALEITLVNNSKDRAAVFHLYNRLNLAAAPHRYTVAAGKSHVFTWPAIEAGHDLWLIGPDGFHAHFINRQLDSVVTASLVADKSGVGLKLENPGAQPVSATLEDTAYGAAPAKVELAAGAIQTLPLALEASHNWYDLKVSWSLGSVRLAGYVETGKDGLSDPGFLPAAQLSLS
jgi:phospholipase C